MYKVIDGVRRSKVIFVHVSRPCWIAVPLLFVYTSIFPFIQQLFTTYLDAHCSQMLRFTSLLFPFLLKLVISFVSKVFATRSVHSFHCNCFIRCIHAWFQCFNCFSAINELVLCRNLGDYTREHVWEAEAIVSSSFLVAVIAAGSVGYLISCNNLRMNPVKRAPSGLILAKFSKN
ncbi:unnamed protein product [Trichobilharzia szidati]|nr:unnamed protein product [Trichobilharzia szidati]